MRNVSAISINFVGGRPRAGERSVTELGEKEKSYVTIFFRAQAFGEALRKDRDGSAEISMLFDVICHWWKVSELVGGWIA